MTLLIRVQHKRKLAVGREKVIRNVTGPMLILFVVQMARDSKYTPLTISQLMSGTRFRNKKRISSFTCAEIIKGPNMTPDKPLKSAVTIILILMHHRPLTIHHRIQPNVKLRRPPHKKQDEDKDTTKGRVGFFMGGRNEQARLRSKNPNFW